MAARRPLVRVGGQNVQLPAGDTLAGAGDFKKDGSVKMTGPINEAVPVSMTIGASGAQTVTIDSAAANTVFIDGSGQLTFLGNGTQGNTREVEFNSSVVLANTSRIILPGGADIVTQPGDTAKFRNVDDTNIWKCVWYQRKSGRAVIESGSGPTSTDGLPEGTTNLYYTDARAKAANTDKVQTSSVGAANGVAPLGSDSKIASAYLPSYVDDVLEFANLAAFPATGETGKIYIALDTNREYRWSGSTYIQLVASPGTTDNVPEGTTNLYFTAVRVLGTALAGFASSVGAVTAADTILTALGKLQGTKVDKVTGKQLSTEDYTTTEKTKLAGVQTGAQVNAVTSVATRTGDVVLAKADVGLGNVDNTSDVNKPVSTAQQTAINTKVGLTGNESIANIKVFTGQYTGFQSTAPGFWLDEVGGSYSLYVVLDDNTLQFQKRVSGFGGLAPNFQPIKLDLTNDILTISADIVPPGNNVRNVGTQAARFAGINGVLGNFSGPVLIGQYTLTTLPSAATYTGYEIDVTNATGGSKRCRSNGTVWQILNTTTTVS
jgi:hypothetical protein